VALAVFAALGRAASPEQEVRAAEKAWGAALVARGAASLDRLLADTLIYAHCTGVVEGKAENLGRIRSGAQHYDAVDHRDITVRIYRATAVSHSHAVMKGTSGTRLFDDRLMLLHVWVRQGGPLAPGGAPEHKVAVTAGWASARRYDRTMRK
jgi:hypothetical protein